MIKKWILLAYFLSYLTKNTIYIIVKSINFNLDIRLTIKIKKDSSFAINVLQMDKKLLTIQSWKARFFTLYINFIKLYFLIFVNFILL